MQLAKIVLCHPELAPRVALLAPHLDNTELKGFVDRLLDKLVRFYDLPPREALAKVPVARTGQLIGLADRVRLDGPDRVLGLSTAMSMLEEISRDYLERHALEGRLGALQPLLAAADADDDNDERKRLLAEQRAIVAALQALDHPMSRTAAVVERVVAALPAPQVAPVPSAASSGSSGSPLVSVTMPSPTVLVPDDVVPAAPVRPTSRPPTPADDPPWAGDIDDDPWAV